MRSLPFWHLYWNDSDGCELVFPDRTVPFPRTQLAVIPPHVIFATRMERMFEHFYIDFTVHVPRFAAVAPEVIFLDAAPYRQELERNFDDYNLQLMQGYALLFRILLDLPESCFAGNGDGAADRRLRDILDYIGNNCAAGLTNTALAGKAGMSLSGFQHQFKQHTGISPREYLINCRLDAARNLLLNTALDIGAIARQTGFADRYHFSKVFKRHFGATPAVFRRGNGLGGVNGPDAVTR